MDGCVNMLGALASIISQYQTDVLTGDVRITRATTTPLCVNTATGTHVFRVRMGYGTMTSTDANPAPSGDMRYWGHLGGPQTLSRIMAQAQDQVRGTRSQGAQAMAQWI